MPYDLLVKNGLIVDGTGAPGAAGDVGIAGGRVVEIGRLSGPAARVIDAGGRAVAPFLGRAPLRRYVMGGAASEREATEDEVAAMQAVLRRALAAGAVGLSSSIGPTHLDPSGRPVPSRFAAPDELVALASV